MIDYERSHYLALRPRWKGNLCFLAVTAAVVCASVLFLLVRQINISELPLTDWRRASALPIKHATAVVEDDRTGEAVRRKILVENPGQGFQAGGH